VQSEAAALKVLREAYRGTNVEVRFFPQCVTCWRWQIGRNGDGEHFELLAWSSTPGGLIEAIKAKAQSRNGG